MTDESIIELFWNRSETAISETEQLYGRYFHSIVYGILWNEEDAKEVVNDMYLKAWETIPPERPIYLKAFLGRITRQLSIKRLERNTAKKRGVTQSVLVIDELAECIPDGNGVEDFADMTALRDTLNTFLRSLKPEVRVVFVRRYWHMQSISIIAQECAMSESKVKSMLMRTRNKLKKYLSEEGYVI